MFGDRLSNEPCCSPYEFMIKTDLWSDNTGLTASWSVVSALFKCFEFEDEKMMVKWIKCRREALSLFDEIDQKIKGNAREDDLDRAPMISSLLFTESEWLNLLVIGMKKYKYGDMLSEKNNNLVSL
jgi:hypothetical protein